MIRHVLPDSVFHNTLKRGDLVESIEFDLPTINKDSLVIPKKEQPVRVIGKIESHGDVSLSRADGKADERLSSRKFSIPEIADYMSAGSKLGVSFNRRGILHQKDIDFQPKEDTFRVRGSYHVLEPPSWTKVGGVVMQNTSLNNLAECSRYKYITEIPYYDDFLFSPSVIVTHVDPSSEVGSLSAFSEGDIVMFVDGKEVSNIFDIKRICKGKRSVSVETDRGAFAICNLDQE